MQIQARLVLTAKLGTGLRRACFDAPNIFAAAAQEAAAKPALTLGVSKAGALATSSAAGPQTATSLLPAGQKPYDTSNDHHSPQVVPHMLQRMLCMQPLARLDSQIAACSTSIDAGSSPEILENSHPASPLRLAIWLAALPCQFEYLQQGAAATSWP